MDVVPDLSELKCCGQDSDAENRCTNARCDSFCEREKQVERERPARESEVPSLRCSGQRSFEEIFFFKYIIVLGFLFSFLY